MGRSAPKSRRISAIGVNRFKYRYAVFLFKTLFLCPRNRSRYLYTT